MSARGAAWIAWSLCALSVALTALSLLLLAQNLSYPNSHVFPFWFQDTVIAAGFSTVGALIASRRAHHPIGWLFCATGLLAGVEHLCGEYAAYALLVRAGSLPGGEALAWVVSWLWVPQNGLMAFLALLFPDGRLPSRRWRPFAWLIVIVIVIGTVAVAFLPAPISGLGPVENPVGKEGLENVDDLIDALVEALSYGVLGLVVVASLLLRFRHAGGVKRQQIKWFAYAASAVVLGAILAYGVSDATDVEWVKQVGFTLLAVGLIEVPIAVGIAILRYHLYDIDLLINRTLVYGSLTAVLVVLYFGAIVLLQRLLVLLTGEKSTLAVVASTLAIATLFNPLRYRIQAFIDRRFYRSKYDAAKTLTQFSSKLREETDLDALSEDLVGVVRETMQPAHVSLWLRPGPSPKGGTDEPGGSRR